MAIKRTHGKPAKLKRSFVVTFSAVAAMSGCADTTDGVSHNPPGPYFRDDFGGIGGPGGNGGAGVGGAGVGGAGVGGAGGAAGDFVAPAPCPIAAPVDGTACEVSSLMRCEYVLSTDECAPNGYEANATCEDGVWDVDTSITACNPPPPDPDTDAGTDDDAGLEDEDAGR
jgi:hypothetical protein